MKTRFFAIFLPLFFLLGSLGAEAATFQPNWKTGDTFRYETSLSFQSAEYSNQLDAEPSYETQLDTTVTIKYEVLQKNLEYTEFAVSLENIEVRTPEKQAQFDIRLQDFLKKTVLHYQIDSQGKIIKVTQVDQLIQDYRQEFGPRGSEYQAYEDISIEFLINLWLNYSNYSPLPLSSYHSPHHSLYMGKDFNFDQAQENPIILTYAPMIPFTIHTIQLELPGTTTLEKNNTGLKFTSKYHFDKKDTVLWGQTVLDRLLLTPEERKDYQKELDQYAQSKKPQKISGSLVDMLEVKDLHSLPDHSQSIFEFTASGKSDKETDLTFYRGKFTLTSTRLE